MKPVVHYTSGQLRLCIRKLFREPKASGRRVLIVAYIGVDYAKFLPNPKGMEIICSPTPGATSAEAVQKLIDAGATVRFSDRLHMKVYWAQKLGCLIASANLSDNALGMNALKEMGVLVDANSVDIDRLIKEARPYPAKNKLAWLRKEGEKVKLAMAKAGRRVLYDPKRYIDWYTDNPKVRRAWKLAWWDGDAKPAEAALQFVERHFDKSQPWDWLNVDKAHVRKGDWLLCFGSTRGRVQTTSWLYVDGIVPVRKAEQGTYDEEFPFQAFQGEEPICYDAPPFVVGRKFAQALTKAIRMVGAKKVENSNYGTPPRALLNALARMKT
ncbi:hypothetical protein JIR23_29855 [Bradyrhizobium diazoefficiens]|nr:hypothetical protein [Bradyrhizobium diazoefficiens]QQN63667.1 hypothetical protein JIR23_29855 [Bradyrhizobium diazoefficiens]